MRRSEEAGGRPRQGAAQPMATKPLRNGLLPRVLGLEAELQILREACKLLEMECKGLRGELRDSEDVRREDRMLLEELRAIVVELARRQREAAAPTANKGVGFRERDSVVDIDNCITGAMAHLASAGSLRSVKDRVPTAYARMESVSSGASSHVSFVSEGDEDATSEEDQAQAAREQQGRRQVKGRTPTGFVKGPAASPAAAEDAKRSVSFDPAARDPGAPSGGKRRVPTAFAHEALAAEDDERSVSFDPAARDPGPPSGGKRRVPTAFAHEAPAAEDDERSVSFDPAARDPGAPRGGKRRVPTAFAHEVPAAEEEAERSITFDAAACAGGAPRAGKRRVPTAFAHEAPAAEEEDDGEAPRGEGFVRFSEEAAALGERCTANRRVPTGFARVGDGDDEESEGDGGRQVTFDAAAAAGGQARGGKRRVPTAFAPPPRAEEEDDEDAEDRHVRIDDGGAGHKSTNKKRVPTSYARLDTASAESDSDASGRAVRFEAGATPDEGKTKKKARLPTAFATPTPGGESDEDEDEEMQEAHTIVTFKPGETEGEGKERRKMRVPTGYAPAPADEERKLVTFRTQDSVTEIAAQESEGHRPVKHRVPTSFARPAPVATAGAEGDEDDDGSESSPRSTHSKSTRFSEVVDDIGDGDDGEALDGEALEHLRPARGRIPTAFVKISVPPQPDEGDAGGRREQRARLPTALGRRGSEDCGESAVSRATSEMSSSRSWGPEFETEQFRVPGAAKDSALIVETLRSLNFFTDLHEDTCARFAQEMEVFDLPSGAVVAQQGSLNGTHFFVVEQGTFEVTRDGKRVAMVSRGGLLGESVILLSGAQNATVCARGPARAYAMTGVRARAIFSEQYHHGKKEVILALNQVLRSPTSCSLLHNLTQYQEHMLYDEAVVQSFAAGDMLERRGSTDTARLHVLLRGTTHVEAPEGDGKTEVARFSAVGDLGLVYGASPFTVVCNGPVQTLVLARDLLERMFGEKLRERVLRCRVCDLLMQHETFAVLGVEQLEAAAGIGSIVELQPGEELRKEKVVFLMAFAGDFEAEILGAPPVALSAAAGGHLGQERLLQGGEPWTLAMRNTGAAVVRAVVWEDAKLQAILSLGIVKRGDSVWVSPEAESAGGANRTRIVRSPSMRLAVLHDDKVGALRKVFYLKTLSAELLQLLADTLVVEYAAAGDVIFERGSEGDEFFIIHSGLLEVSIEDRKIRTLGVGDYVGERALLMAEPRSATVAAKEASEVWRINASAFRNAIKGPILEYMKDRIAFQDTKVDIESLACLRVVGKGGFGVVKMVRSMKTQTRYALKCVSIQQAIDTKQQQNLVAERSILAELDHPFVIKFIRTFKSKQYVYFLMELVTGGELLEALQVLGLLSRKQAQFYVGSIALALEFLHERRIAYLDLKGENCLIDTYGYLKIIDFGVAERVVDGKIFMTRGTCYYMAPEVILPVQGYTTTADLWSLGVVAYDFMTGEFPFANDITDPWHAQATNQILSEILEKSKKPLKYPNPKALDKATKSFIQGLLQANPQKRLGAGRGGFEEIKAHPFFDGFSWDGLLARSVEPPYVPHSEVYAEDSAPGAAAPDELRVVEDAPDADGSVREVVDPEPGWLDEF